MSGEVAVIVYVAQKTPHARLARTDVIPLDVEGVKTDVQVEPLFEQFGGTTLNGGVQIRRSPDERGRPKPGTLGYVATRISGNLNVMLSCEHVMLSRRRGDMRIFHPDVSRCCGSLKNAVGGALSGYEGLAPHTNSHGTEEYYIDAATASIISGVTARKVIPSLGPITGPGDLTATPVGPGDGLITVRKRGAETDVTGGTVDDVAFSAGRLMKIRPKAGETFPFSKTWKVPPEDIPGHLAAYPAQSLGGSATQVSADEVRFDIPVFAVPGDSGAAVVSGGKIVGLVISGSMYELPAFDEGLLRIGGMPSGFTIACHIQPVLAKLGIRLDPSTETSGGRGALVPGDEINVDPPKGMVAINARLEAIVEALDATDGGRRVNDLVRTHADELMELVHHHRRVLVEWHRSRGPAFSALALEALLNDARPLPSAVNEVPREAMLIRMKKVLDAEGSSALRAAMADNERFLLDRLARSRTVSDLVANLA
ncbi:MAG: S1 family peptidase [Chloroflexota bacterium]|nr:S1 family peptidase [Chloroflexota bacterium]